MPNDAEKKAVELLKAKGYRIKRPGNYIKVNFQIHEDIMGSFREMVERLDYPQAEAVTEALEAWVEKKKEEIKNLSRS